MIKELEGVGLQYIYRKNTTLHVFDDFHLQNCYDVIIIISSSSGSVLFVHILSSAFYLSSMSPKNNAIFHISFK